MASFNQGEAVLAKNKPSAAKFDASQAILASSHDEEKKSARDRLMQGMQQRMASTEDLGRGVGDFASGARAGLQNLGAYATSALPQPMQIPRFDPQPTSSYGNIPIEAGKFASSFAPGIGAEKAVVEGLGAIEQIPGWLSRVAGGSVGGAVSAPSVDASPLTGAALGTAGAAIPESVMGMLGKYLGKNVTPEEFESARQSIPENIRAPIGELADSPRAKTRYGKARGIALSQADTPYQQLYDHLREETKALTADAPSVGNPSQYVYDDVSGSYEKARANTKKSYSSLSDYADVNNVPFNRASYDNSIDESIKEVRGKIKNKETKKLYGGALDALEDFKQTDLSTFSDATTIRPSINELIKKAVKGDDLVTARYFEKMKEGLDSSIAESSKADPNLLKLHEAAKRSRIHQGTYEKLNRDDYSPFYKIYSKGGTPDNLIGSHIRTSTKGDDFSGLLEALTEKLSPKAKGVLAKAHLQPTEDTSLAKQIGKIKKLSPTQRDLMFGDNAPTAHSISKISGLYPSAASADFTPKTGYTAGKINQLLAEISGLSLGVGAGAATHSPAIIAGTAATAAALPAYGQLMQRALRSEALKNAHMKYLQRSGKEALTKATPTGQAMRTGLLALLGGNQNGT